MEKQRRRPEKSRSELTKGQMTKQTLVFCIGFDTSPSLEAYPRIPIQVLPLIDGPQMDGRKKT